jgi:hypothetical protein
LAVPGAATRLSDFMTSIAEPGRCEICASRSRRRSDAGLVYVSFQPAPDAIMRTSRTVAPSYALVASDGT